MNELVRSGAFLALGALSVGLLLSAWRLVRGPGMPDRLVALDMIAVIGVGMLAAYAIAEDVLVVLDAALAVALITFVGTVAFSAFLEKGGAK